MNNTANAKKLKSGNWRCLAYIGKDRNGKRIYKSFTAPTKKEAELMALTFTGEEKEKNDSNVTLGEIVDRYIDSKSNILSASTILGYKRIRKSCFENLFRLNLTDINSAVLQSYVNTESAKVSSKTVKNRFGLIISALKNYDPERSFSVRYPLRIKPDIQIPSNEDIIKLWEYTKGSNMELPILLGAYVGLRRSEICAIDKVINNMLPINKVMLINDSGEWITQNRTKTEAGNRLAYPPPFVMEVIKKTELPIHLTPNQISKKFRKITSALGLPNYRFHDLRHYYASVLMSAGIPDKYVMERIGHSTDNMLKTVYQHTMKEKNMEINQTIDKVFAQMQHKMQHKGDKP